MAFPPRITDESVFSRWIRIEIARMNDGLVVDRIPLELLLKAEKPSAVTKKGETYYFNKAVIELLGRSMTDDLQRKLRLPIFFYLSSEVPDSCSCTDASALAALQLMGELSTQRVIQEGRFWVARPIVYSIMGKYPTMVQVVAGA